mgnify:FL=1
MRDCEIRPFENCIRKVKYTNKIASQDFKPSGRFPIVSQEEAFISGYWDNPEDVFHIDGPVVIFGDHSRHIKYVDFDFVIGADGVKILAPVEDIDTKYLYYYLKSQPIQSLGYSRHYKVLKEKYVPVLSLAEQQRIVVELDLLSRVIELKNAQIRTLDELAQSIFYEMFGDPVSNEKVWDTLKMKVVAPQKGYSGNIPMHNGKQWLLNLDMVESQTGQILEKVLLSPTEIGNSTTTFNEENVLYSKLRPYLNKVVIPDEPGYCTSELVPLLPDKDKLNRVFLAYLLRSKFFVEYINARVAGAKMPRVSMSDFRDFDVILPHYTLQESFAGRMLSIENQKRIIKNSMLAAKDLLASRMDKYFNE